MASQSIYPTLGQSGPLGLQDFAGLVDSTVNATAARRDIAHMGDPAASAVFIHDGWACRYRMLTDGRRQFVSLLLPGDADQLIEPAGTRNCGIAAITEVRWSRIPYSRLSSLANASAELRAIVSSRLSAELSRSAEWALSLGRRTALERVAHFCCEVFSRLSALGLATGDRCAFPLTQTDLAEALGLTSVHVNRTLQALRAQQLIQLRDRTLWIRNFRMLASAGDFSPDYLKP